MVKIMSLMQNMWERPLRHELRKVQARIDELEADGGGSWPKKPLSIFQRHDRYKRMDAIVGLLSAAHTERFELIKKLQTGRWDDD